MARTIKDVSKTSKRVWKQLMKKKEQYNLLSKAQDGNDLILIAYAIIASQNK